MGAESFIDVCSNEKGHKTVSTHKDSKMGSLQVESLQLRGWKNQGSQNKVNHWAPLPAIPEWCGEPGAVTALMSCLSSSGPMTLNAEQ